MEKLKLTLGRVIWGSFIMEVEFTFNSEGGQNADDPIWMLLCQQNYRDARSLNLGLEPRKPGFNSELDFNFFPLKC